MTLSWFTLIWLLVAVGCIVVGAILTVRDKDEPEKNEPAVPLKNPSTESLKNEPAASYCRNCGEPMEPDARFCGVCGKYRSERSRWQTVKTNPKTQSGRQRMR